MCGNDGFESESHFVGESGSCVWCYSTMEASSFGSRMTVERTKTPMDC